MTNLEKLDFIIEWSMNYIEDKSERANFPNMFLGAVFSSGYTEEAISCITLALDARVVARELNTQMILSEIMKYGDRVKYLTLNERNSSYMMRKCLFLNIESSLSALEYITANGPEAIKELQEFFATNRYNPQSPYNKKNSDSDGAYSSCNNKARKVDEFFGVDVARIQ